MMNEDFNLRKLIRSAGTEDPGEGFTARVMEQVKASPKVTPAYKPIISRKVWMVIAAAIVAVVIVALNADASQSWSLEKYAVRIPSLSLHLENLTSPHPLLPLIVISIFLLFVLEYFFVSRRHLRH